MRVVVDTTVWSLVLRRDSGGRSLAQRSVTLELTDLIRDGRTVLIGAVRQEVLCGFSDVLRFQQLRDHLRAFDDEPILTRDHERAAESFNICRRAGIQGSQVDFLICAVAERLNAAVFSLDEDFTHYTQHLPIALHTVRDESPS